MSAPGAGPRKDLVWRGQPYPELRALNGSSMGWLIQPLRDTEGRPCGEFQAPDEAKEGVPFEFRKCPYPGSRNGKPMNVSALRQLTTHWDTIIADTAYLRAEYCSRYGVTEFDFLDLWRFGAVMMAVPAFFVRRAGGPGFEAPLPPAIATFFKTSAGIATLSAYLVGSGYLLMHLHEKPDVEHLVTIAETHSAFIESTGNVCAGPPNMLRDYLTSVLCAHPETRPSASSLSELIGDVDAFFVYAESFIDVGFVSITLGMQAASSLQELRRSLVDLAKNHPVVSEILTQMGGASGEGTLAESPEESRAVRALVESVRSPWEDRVSLESCPLPAEDESQVLALERILGEARPDAPAAARKKIAASLSGYLAFESRVLSQLRGRAKMIEEALGHEAKEPISSWIIDRAEHVTPRSLLSKWAGITIETFVGKAAIGSVGENAAIDLPL